MITAELERILVNRVVIEQAKGVMMVAYGLDDQRAFDMLVSCSQAWNVKVAVIAERLLVGARKLGNLLPPPISLDHLMLEIRAEFQEQDNRDG